MRGHLDWNNRTLLGLPSRVILGSLTSMDLSGNFLSSFTMDMLHLSHLRALDLSHNMIANFTPRFESPAALERLNLSHNRLWVIDDLPVRLQALNVSHNAIRRLPTHMTALVNLQTLDLSYNQLVDNLGTTFVCTRRRSGCTDPPEDCLFFPQAIEGCPRPCSSSTRSPISIYRGSV